MLNPENAKFIDAYIRDNLVTLNKNGIHTYWSCSGLHEDHLEFDERQAFHTYVSIELSSASKHLESLSKAIASKILYTPEEWYTNLGNIPEGINRLAKARAVNSHIEGDWILTQRMWSLEIDCLLNMKGEPYRPTMIIRPDNVGVLFNLPEELRDAHIKLRWDRLFEVLLNLE